MKVYGFFVVVCNMSVIMAMEQSALLDEKNAEVRAYVQALAYAPSEERSTISLPFINALNQKVFETAPMVFDSYDDMSLEVAQWRVGALSDVVHNYWKPYLTEIHKSEYKDLFSKEELIEASCLPMIYATALASYQSKVRQ